MGGIGSQSVFFLSVSGQHRAYINSSSCLKELNHIGAGPLPGVTVRIRARSMRAALRGGHAPQCAARAHPVQAMQQALGHQHSKGTYSSIYTEFYNY